MANESETLDKIKKLLKTDKIVYGTDRAYKEITRKNASEIVLSSNVPDDVELDLTKYANLSDLVITKINLTNDLFGTFCKKPYAISVLTILK
ncbi:hypothetical protein HOD20_04595 [archaeon]|jgi:large subunit ribosomal protein L30e|nr:hypothetical protein [archaeon]MBT4351785.1 hypothetical protein [archaeon]MBT4648561.1 hypothetical protein [archaeon]MBT6822629.1 hypothetical protein [archaeon]MBT7392667.1 hypothetical protein [archaeon]